VLADSALTLEQQDLFSASQIIHLKPLVGEDTYRRFVAANPFVSRFYPNFRVTPAMGRRSGWNPFARGVKRLVEAVMAAPSMLVEHLCRSLGQQVGEPRRGAGIDHGGSLFLLEAFREDKLFRLERVACKVRTKVHVVSAQPQCRAHDDQVEDGSRGIDDEVAAPRCAHDAVKIARDWNVPASGSGFVTRFEVRRDFLEKYRVEDAGGRAHREYWIPAGDLSDFNAAIVGVIEVIQRFPG